MLACIAHSFVFLFSVVIVFALLLLGLGGHSCSHRTVECPGKRFCRKEVVSRCSMNTQACTVCSYYLGHIQSMTKNRKNQTKKVRRCFLVLFCFGYENESCVIQKLWVVTVVGVARILKCRWCKYKRCGYWWGRYIPSVSSSFREVLVLLCLGMTATTTTTKMISFTFVAISPGNIHNNVLLRRVLLLLC